MKLVATTRLTTRPDVPFSGRRATTLSAALAAVASAAIVGCASSDEPSATSSTTDDVTTSSDATQSDATPGAQTDVTTTEGDTATDLAADVEAPPPLSFCEGATEALYDPVAGETLGVFPDDFWSVDNADSPSGVRLHFEKDLGWVKAVPGTFGANVYELEGTPGFGTSAGVFFRFSDKIREPKSGDPDSLTSTAVLFVEMMADGKVRHIPYEAFLTDEDTTLMVEPLVPLTPNTLHAVVVTNEVVGMDGACTSPSATTRALLTGTAAAPALDRLEPRFARMLAATHVDPALVSAAAIFTTQDPVADDLVVAADVKSHSYAWKNVSCSVKTKGVKRCEAAFDGFNYRSKDKVYAGGKPTETWTYPISLWLPDTKGPHPTVLYAHGIGGSRDQAGMFGDYFASLGIAIVSIDAVEHADHPGGSSGGGQADVLGFFAVDFSTASVNGRVLRDNWRQAAWDKLQLVSLFEDAPDVDGDGEVDLDIDRIAYFGVSLGGIMGGELLALTDRVGAAVLDVCGGRLTSILRDSQSLSIFATLAAPEATQGEVRRFFQMAQTLIEPGDPVNYVRHLYGERLPDSGTGAPNVLLQIAISDEVIPSSASWALTRALGVKIIPPIKKPVTLVVPEQGKLPISGNAAGGTATAGLFQFDRVRYETADKPAVAAHSNTPGSLEAVTQSIHFLQTWFDTGTAEILDPYAETGTPNL